MPEARFSPLKVKLWNPSDNSPAKRVDIFLPIELKIFMVI
jgi:hypothetical protein